MIDTLKIGGVETQLLLLLRLLDRSRIHPFLCLLNGESETSRRLEPANCPVLRLGVRSLHRPSSLVKAFRLASFLRRQGIDVLQTFFHDSTYFGAPVAKLAGVRCVVRSRLDIGFWVRPIDRWLGRMCGLLVDGTLTNCEACSRSIIVDEGAPRDSVAIIPNGVVLDRFASVPEPAPFGRNGRPPRVGIVANLSPMKNHELLVRAARVLADAHPRLEYHLVGEGESRPELERLIASLGLQDRFKLLGTVSDIPAFLAGLDVAVLCSRSEGAPNAIMEYMAAARPIVATSVGGVTEIMRHEQEGLLVPHDNAASLAAAIDRLLRDPALAARLGHNARRRALREYDAEVYARRYEEFYLDLHKKIRH